MNKELATAMNNCSHEKTELLFTEDGTGYMVCTSCRRWFSPGEYKLEKRVIDLDNEIANLRHERAQAGKRAMKLEAQNQRLRQAFGEIVSKAENIEGYPDEPRVKLSDILKAMEQGDG